MVPLHKFKQVGLVTLLLLLLSGILLSCAPPQQDRMNVIRLELEGIRYDSLSLRLTLPDFERKLIAGYSDDGYNWEFSYPDSLYDYIGNFAIIVLGTPDNVGQSLGFSLVFYGDTMESVNLRFGRPLSLVRANYIRTTGPYEGWIRKPGTEDEFIMGSFFNDFFEILTNDKEVVSSIKSMHYGHGFFAYRHPRTVGLTYEEIIQRDMEFIKQNPNFRGMLISVFYNIALFNSNDDIAKLFNLFTPELQQSFYGQKIYRHITRCMTFVNQKLPTWDTGVLELIVQDSSKFNLILFSASWCAPCIRQIPILKEIYRDLGHKLIMTYVSIDHEQTAESWREKMREYQIPWRSLMVLTREKGRTIQADYAVQGVPDAFLVHPHSMEKERLVLWEETHRQRLYELVK
ncbi:MAG: thioredoxin domain-containing protein [Bacteroidales bacterium]|nr:thioredoxin domain-containing protein [Bacteroidales bacterium]